MIGTIKTIDHLSKFRADGLLSIISMTRAIGHHSDDLTAILIGYFS